MIVTVSNQRPIQVYSNKVTELFRLHNEQKVQIVAIGGAIPTALRVARFIVRQFKEDPGWKIVSDIIEESKVEMIDREAPKPGQIPQGPKKRNVNRVVVELVRIS